MPRLDLSKPQEEMSGGVNQTDLSEGVYDVKVKSAEFGTDDKNRDKLVIDFETEDGSVFRKWLYLHQPETKRISLDQLGRLGTPKNWSPKNTAAIVGKKCRIEVGRDNTGDYASVEKIFQQTIDPGKYTCLIDEIGKQENARNSDKPFRRLFFKILDQGEFKDLRIADRLYFNEKSMGFTASKLQSMGATRSDFDTDNENHMAELCGKTVEVTLSIRRTADGKEFANVKNVKLTQGGAPAAASNVVSVDNSEVAGFDDDDEDEIPF